MKDSDVKNYVYVDLNLQDERWSEEDVQHYSVLAHTKLINYLINGENKNDYSVLETIMHVSGYDQNLVIENLKFFMDKVYEDTVNVINEFYKDDRVISSQQQGGLPFSGKEGTH